uniref:Uncharacterized protein n=1 Tax=Rhizophora mucronata TaxID=61149 RepID=A0A2P2N622_RHIMU
MGFINYSRCVMLDSVDRKIA